MIENENVKIGGPGKTGNRRKQIWKEKVSQGQEKGRCLGVWRISFERESKNCFLTSVPDRSAETLFAKIKEHVLPGTNIISDCWKIYIRLAEEGYCRANESSKVASLRTFSALSVNK